MTWTTRNLCVGSDRIPDAKRQGSIGAAIAQLTAAASYDAALSNSRAPETLKNLVELLGPNARPAAPAEAAAAGRPRRGERTSDAFRGRNP